MKSDHRHELKTNELAEWLVNLPQWAKENRTTIVAVVAVIVVVAAIYFWRYYTKNVVLVRQQLQFTGLISQVSQSKRQVLQAHRQGRDLSFILLQPAENLRMFAQNTNNDQMAALAFIERAEAIRVELYYRGGRISEEDFKMQINQAKASYSEAIRLSPNKTLVSTAKFGLGLCEEELGDFDNAQQIYREIVDNPDFDGSTAKAAAAHRLEIITDYEDGIIFIKAPEPEPAITLGSQAEMIPAEINLPGEVNLPGANY
jgi:tetratricopeptide (TPR) repeat protein